MTRIAVTGHMDLAAESAPLIRDQISAVLLSHEGPIVGVSCIARGADSLFAETVLAHGGTLEVVLPSADYRATKVTGSHAALFDELMAAAASVHVMPSQTADRAAYEAANRALLDGVDLLAAVWDGDASRRGGTGTVVDEARSAGIPVTVIWPDGARRQRKAN